jgi:hypothetical protein
LIDEIRPISDIRGPQQVAPKRPVVSVLRRSKVMAKPIVVYPNTGEAYGAVTKH